MSMEWIRKTYGVPAKRGGRVEYTGGKTPEQGTITAARGGYLRIRLDGMEYTHPLPFHPTYELRYLDAPPPPQPNLAVTLEEYFERQIEWSRETFGPALRTGGVIDHIRKELREIEADPHDLSEWVDVVILAMDGFWRHGGKASDLLPALLAKQRKNMARTWPDWRTMSENSAIEHNRSHDVPTTEGSTDG